MFEVSCGHISASLIRLSSVSLIDNVSDLLLTHGMKTIEEIRHARLKMLVAEYGSISALSDVLKMSHSQVSQWVNQSIDHKSKKPRTMSSPIARRVEKLTKKPEGWMDQHIYAEDFDRIFGLLMGVGDKKQVLKIESIIRTLVDEDHAEVEDKSNAVHQEINEKRTRESAKNSEKPVQQVTEDRRHQERRAPETSNQYEGAERRKGVDRRKNGNHDKSGMRFGKTH